MVFRLQADIQIIGNTNKERYVIEHRQISTSYIDGEWHPAYCLGPPLAYITRDNCTTERLSCRMRFCVGFYTKNKVKLVQVNGERMKIK
jgi:hypothetical protein